MPVRAEAGRKAVHTGRTGETRILKTRLFYPPSHAGAPSMEKENYIGLYYLLVQTPDVFYFLREHPTMVRMILLLDSVCTCTHTHSQARPITSIHVHACV